MAEEPADTPPEARPSQVGDKPAGVLRKIVRNVFSSWIYIAASAVTSIFLTPYLIRHLGDAGYGIITLLAGLVGYSGILYLGMGGAVVRYTAEYLAKKDKAQLDETLSTIFTVYFASGLFCLVFCLAMIYPLPYFFRVPRELLGDARALLVMMGVTLFVEFATSVYSGYVQGSNRYDVINGRMLVILVFRVVATIVVVEVHPSVMLVGAVTTGCAIVEALYTVFYVKRTNPNLHISFKLFRKSRLKLLWGFSLSNLLVIVSMALIQSTDEAVVAQALGPIMVTIYVIPLRLTDYARQAMDKATETLVPPVVDAAAKRDLEKVRMFWRFTVKIALALTYPIVLVLLWWGHDVVQLWIGKRHADQGYYAMIFLAFAFLAHVPGRSVTYPVMIAFNNLKPVVRVVAVEAILNFVLSIILVRTSLGVGGVALGTAIPSALTGFVFLPWVACREIGVSYLRHTFETVVRGAFAIPVTVAAMWGLGALGMTRNIPLLALACVVVLVVHLGATSLLSLSKKDRELVLAKIRRR